MFEKAATTNGRQNTPDSNDIWGMECNYEAMSGAACEENAKPPQDGMD